MEQKRDLEPKPGNSSDPSRRKFLKTMSFLAGATAGVGEAPFQMAASEVMVNKSREGNSVTITLKDGKKVSLVLGIHNKEFEEGQTLPASDILAAEIGENFKEKIQDPKYAFNNLPVLLEMQRSNKFLYNCDVSAKELLINEILNMDIAHYKEKTQTTYEDIANAALLSALFATITSKIHRREFLLKAFQGLSLGLGSRVLARNFASEGKLEDLNKNLKPADLTAGTILKNKFLTKDSRSALGSFIGSLGEEESWRLLQMIFLGRSIIMAIKLRSALRISGKESVTATIGAGHSDIEELITMEDENLVKRLCLFKEGINKYFYLESLYTMSYAYRNQKGEIQVESKEDALLKELVEKYLK